MTMENYETIVELIDAQEDCSTKTQHLEFLERLSRHLISRLREVKSELDKAPSITEE